MRKIYLLLILLLLFTSTVFAQRDCSFNLIEAEKLFEKGAIERIPELVKKCLENDFTYEENLKAYKLLIQVYLFEDNIAMAERYMQKFLEYEPEYKISPTDAPEFSYLMDKFRTTPVYSLGLTVGANMSKIYVLKNYGTYNTNAEKGEYTPNGIGFHGGFQFSRHLVNNFEINIEAIFDQEKFEYNNTLFNYAQLNYKETQSCITAPLTLSYDVGKRKMRPFIRLGASFSYLLTASALPYRSYIDAVSPAVSGSALSVYENRTKINIAGIVGTGVKYKVKRGYILFDVRYNLKIYNQTITANRYSNSVLLYKYYYTDNDFLMSNLTFSIGYIRSFYKPKMKKNKP